MGMEGPMNPLKNIRKPSCSNERDRRLRDGEYETLTAALSASENPWASQRRTSVVDFMPERPARPGHVARTGGGATG
jgi:hypothetical protein